MIVVLILIAVCGLLLWLLPKAQARAASKNVDAVNWKDLFDAENEARDILAKVIAGFLLLFGAYNTWSEYRLAKQTDFGNRVISSYDLLNSKTLEVRIGSINTLETIALSSPEHHWPIMEVLSRMVREQADSFALSKAILTFDKGGKEAGPWTLFAWPPAEVQAILGVVGRRSRSFRDGEERRLNLREVVLVGADLRGAKLQGADLSEVDFVSTVLQEVSNKHYRGKSQLQGVKLTEAILEGAILTDLDLQGADLRKACLRRADLRGAVLNDADLDGADLHSARLEGADLSLTRNLEMSQLQHACLDRSTKLPEDLYPTQPCQEDRPKPDPCPRT